MDLIEIYRTFHPKANEFTFFSMPHGIFHKIEYIIGHKTDLNKYKKIELIPYLLSDHYVVKVVFNSNKRKKAHIHMEAKRCSTKQNIGQRRNKERN